MIICALFISLVSSHAFARALHDDFVELAPENWGHPNGLIWTVEDGTLHVNQPVWKGQGKPVMPITYLLRFNAFPGPYSDFTIRVTEIAGRFGVALGKAFPEILGNLTPSWYFFNPYETDGRAFQPNDSGGGMIPFAFQGFVDGKPTWAWPKQCPSTWWDTRELKKMVVTFAAGRFRMIADGVLRADFVDKHFDEIELIGFLLMGNPEAGGSQGQVDSFMYSDATIQEVQSFGKITTTWGTVKTSHR
jgi:hypothetical protein